MSNIDSDKIIQFDSPHEFEKWLAINFDKKPGIWLKIAKKGKDAKTITYSEAVELALCFGWIDGIMRRVDNTFVIQRFSPRGKRSIWSLINRGKAEALIKAGKMRPSGLAEVDRAKADGRWEAAYGGSATMTMHPDLKAALSKNKKAKEFFETLNRQNQYAFLFRIHTAQKPETRARRIEQFVKMLEEGKKFY